jgi:hypothetical protein
MSRKMGMDSQYMEDGNMKMFCAAVSGLCANPEAASQGAHEIVRMARGIVRAAYNDNPDQALPDLTGTMIPAPTPESE